MTRLPGLRAAALLLAFCAAPRGLTAQSVVTSEVRGTVADSAGRPIAGTLVTLRTSNGGAERVVTVPRDGTFAFSFLPPGRYELLAEALGWRPLLVQPLRVEAGRTANLRLMLGRTVPPVERRDTVGYASAPQATGAQLAWVDGTTITRLPAAHPELDPTLASSSVVDGLGGLEGLPEKLTTLYVDGQPFHPARHPASAADQSGALLVPRSALAGADLPAEADVEWTLGGANPVAVTTGVDRRAPEAFGLWGGDAGWSGEVFPDKPPSFDSWWWGGATTLGLVADTARVHVALEGGKGVYPLASVVPDSIAALLHDPVAGLASPQLAESSWTSGSLRLGWSLPSGGALQAGVSGTNFKRTAAGQPPVDLGYAAQSGSTEGTDLLADAALARPLSGPVSLEIRAAGSFSRRRFGTTESGALPSTQVLEPPFAFGGAAQEQGEVKRADFGGTVAVHFSRGPHEAKGGIHGLFSSFDYDLMEKSRPLFLFGTAAQVDHSGVYAERTGSLAPVSFSVPAADAFAQYRWAARPGVMLTVGARAGLTAYPIDDIRADERWFKLTGLINKLIPDHAQYFGGIAHGSWDPAGDNRTVLEGGFGLEHGEADPAALYEVIANSGQLTTFRATGDLSAWPASPTTSPAARTASLTLLDPELAPPRTRRGLAGLAHRFGGGTTFRVQGTVRRTDLVLRRSDLNQPVKPALTGEGSRPVQSTVLLSGGVVSGPASGWRRYGEYDAVWALNADGWSRYRGLSVSLDRPIPRGGSIFATYSYSETTDNLVGLTNGDPWATLPPGITGPGSTSWTEGTSDLDIPHRGSVGVVLPFPGRLSGYLSALYRGRSGAPFTPMVRAGLDVNGDGSWSNDVAFIPDDQNAIGVARAAGCETLSGNSFPARNSCRGAAVHELDLRLALGPLALGSAGIEITVDLTNATDQAQGIIDDALFVLQPNTPLTISGGKLTVPYRVNPAFGSFRPRTDRGRQLRIGIRVGPR